MESNVKEFKEHLLLTLQQDGTLEKVKARLRAELFRASSQREVRERLWGAISRD